MNSTVLFSAGVITGVVVTMFVEIVAVIIFAIKKFDKEKKV